MNVQHKFFGTPANLIWDVKEKVLAGKNVSILLKKYERRVPRKPSILDQFTNPWRVAAKIDDYYYSSKGTPQKVTTLYKDSFFWQLEGENAELAFMGFREEDPLFGNNGNNFTYDMPKCDMKFGAEDLETDQVRSLLVDMKVYCNGADLYLYKTTNSFHIYVGSLEGTAEIINWLTFLRAMDLKYPGLIDSNWLKMNVAEQPLRISATRERGLPQLVCVL